MAEKKAKGAEVQALPVPITEESLNRHFDAVGALRVGRDDIKGLWPHEKSLVSIIDTVTNAWTDVMIALDAYAYELYDERPYESRPATLVDRARAHGLLPKKHAGDSTVARLFAAVKDRFLPFALRMNKLVCSLSVTFNDAEHKAPPSEKSTQAGSALEGFAKVCVALAGMLVNCAFLIVEVGLVEVNGHDPKVSIAVGMPWLPSLVIYYAWHVARATTANPSSVLGENAQRTFAIAFSLGTAVYSSLGVLVRRFAPGRKDAASMKAVLSKELFTVVQHEYQRVDGVSPLSQSSDWAGAMRVVAALIAPETKAVSHELCIQALEYVCRFGAFHASLGNAAILARIRTTLVPFRLAGLIIDRELTRSNGPTKENKWFLSAIVTAYVDGDSAGFPAASSPECAPAWVAAMKHLAASFTKELRLSSIEHNSCEGPIGVIVHTLVSMLSSRYHFQFVMEAGALEDLELVRLCPQHASLYEPILAKAASRSVAGDRFRLVFTQESTGVRVAASS